MQYQNGDRVWYHPIIDEQTRYAGIVDGDSWKLGHGALVVNINIVDSSYPYERKRVNAACFEALERRER
jgi:hypothetical protein